MWVVLENICLLLYKAQINYYWHSINKNRSNGSVAEHKQNNFPMWTCLQGKHMSAAASETFP